MDVHLIKKVRLEGTERFFSKHLDSAMCKYIDEIMAGIRTKLDPAVVSAINTVDIVPYVEPINRSERGSGYKSEDVVLRFHVTLNAHGIVFNEDTALDADLETHVNMFVGALAHRLNLKRLKMADDLTLLNGLISKLPKEKK